MGAGARPQCCYGCWRAQPDERIGRAPFSANRRALVVLLGFRQVAVNQLCLGVRELVARAEPEFVHALCTDLQVERAHLALEERLAVAVRRRIAAEDVPAVGEELPADRAGDLVARLAPVDHRPSPLAEFRASACGQNRLPGLGEEELHVLSPLSVERLAESTVPFRTLLLVPARVDDRGKAAVGREFGGLREPAGILDRRFEREGALVVDPLKLHELQHSRIGEDNLGDLSRELRLAGEQPVVVLEQHFELLLGEARDVRLNNHRAKRGGLGRSAADRQLVALAAADTPYPVRDARHLLRCVAVGEHDVPVFRVLVGRCPDELVDVALDVGERQILRVLDVADLALAFLVRNGVRPDDLGPVSGLVEPALEIRRVSRRLDNRDRVGVDVSLVRLDHRLDVHAFDLPMKAGVEPVRPVPYGDGQLLRVCVHADHVPRLVLDVPATLLSFRVHCVTLCVLSRIGVGGAARLHSSIRGLSPQAGGFRRRSNRPSSVSRATGLAHDPHERLPCVQQVLTRHLLFRIILQYAAVFQPRVLFLFRGTRNILPTDPSEYVRRH